MIRVFWPSLIIIFFVSCKKNREEERRIPGRPILKILGAGKPDFKYLHASNIIGREYGLFYEIVGGCTESENFHDSLDKHNQRVFAQLNQEFGVDWRKQFDAKADTMEFLINQAESFVQLETDYEKRAKELERNKIIVDLWTEPTAKREVFNVEAYEVTLSSPDSNRKVYYSWLVDLSKRKILKSACNNCNWCPTTIIHSAKAPVDHFIVKLIG